MAPEDHIGTLMKRPAYPKCHSPASEHTFAALLQAECFDSNSRMDTRTAQDEGTIDDGSSIAPSCTTHAFEPDEDLIKAYHALHCASDAAFVQSFRGADITQAMLGFLNVYCR
ncbi:Uu.00g109010.m01.CDS01 [Anthostomella pinea]|uniref:Uu.00g109010.m01.CDS01 n=1 Tax=Anthostomella pinea TaxID=933095 RepID=A0AAI8YG46_9PEZI|nr:Uu.00g109010.m01.CDS01 [Anthostomella pinea]